MEDMQVSMSGAMAQASLNIQSNMAAAIIGGSTGQGSQGQGPDMQAARASGMAAQGVGSRLNVQA